MRKIVVLFIVSFVMTRPALSRVMGKKNFLYNKENTKTFEIKYRSIGRRVLDFSYERKVQNKDGEVTTKKITGEETLNISATLKLDKINLEEKIEGHIRLKKSDGWKT